MNATDVYLNQVDQPIKLNTNFSMQKENPAAIDNR